jgi:CheY-like chemotaxis protein
MAGARASSAIRIGEMRMNGDGREIAMLKTKDCIYHSMDVETQRGASARMTIDACGRTAHMSTILIVDNDDGIREMMDLVLVDELGNCIIHSAATGCAFLELMKTTKSPDLILLDVRLPDASGVSLYNTLRQNPSMSRVPVLFVTANPELVRQAALDGPYACLPKPFALDHFVNLVRSLLHTPAIPKTLIA